MHKASTIPNCESCKTLHLLPLKDELVRCNCGKSIRLPGCDLQVISVEILSKFYHEVKQRHKA